MKSALESLNKQIHDRPLTYLTIIYSRALHKIQIWILSYFIDMRVWWNLHGIIWTYKYMVNICNFWKILQFLYLFQGFSQNTNLNIILLYQYESVVKSALDYLNIQICGKPWKYLTFHLIQDLSQNENLNIILFYKCLWHIQLVKGVAQC